MSALLSASLLLASTVKANILPPRQAPLKTLEIPLPTQAEPFTSTVSACDTVEAFAVVGVPTSAATFVPGTLTIYLPPQANPASTTIFDTALNASEVIFATPLAGDCEEIFIPPPSPTGTESSSPTPTAEVCPEGGCSGEVIKTAKLVINAINKVTLLSQNLQTSAKRLGESVGRKRDVATPLGPVDDIARGLRDIATTLTGALPRFAFVPPFPPGCDTDTIVIALIQFVRVHQALLNILIGQSGLLTQGPIKREDFGVTDEGTVHVYERNPARRFKDGDSAFIGAAIAAALRLVEGAVDTTAFTILKLIPTRSECAKQQKDAIDGSLDEAIKAYSP